MMLPSQNQDRRHHRPGVEFAAVLEQMIRAGMNVARLNFSHGEFSAHRQNIENIRAASKAAGRPVAIMADLSGPKMRIGQIAAEPIQLKAGGRFTLTTEDIVGDQQRVSVSFARLPKVVKPGDKLSLNDGYIQLEVAEVARQRGGVRGHCGRRIALAQRTEPAGHRSRHQRVHGAGSRVSAIRAGAWRGRGQPVLCRRRGGHASRAQGGTRTGPRAFSHREDRAFARPGAARRDSRRGGRHHDRARRSGRGSAHRANRGRTKGHHAPGQPAGQTRHHRHADAGVHDPLIACRRAPRRPTSRTPSSTAPMP